MTVDEAIRTLASLLAPVSITATSVGVLCAIALITRYRSHPLVRAGLIALPSGVATLVANSAYTAAFAHRANAVLADAGGPPVTAWTLTTIAAIAWPVLAHRLTRIYR